MIRSSELYEQHYDDGEFETYYRMQLKNDEIEQNVGYIFVGPKTKPYGIPPEIFEKNDNYTAFKEFNADDKTTKTIFATQPKQFSLPQLKDILDSTKKPQSGTHSSEKTTNKMKFNELHSKCNCIDGLIVYGRQQSNQFTLSLSTPPHCEFFKKPTSILLEKLNKEKIGDIKI